MVAAQVAGLLEAGGIPEATRKQHIGGETDDERAGGPPQQHHDHAPEPKPGRLLVEVEVTEPGRRNGRGGEVQGVVPAESVLAPVGEPQHDGRHHEQCRRDGEGEIEQRVHVMLQRTKRVEQTDPDGLTLQGRGDRRRSARPRRPTQGVPIMVVQSPSKTLTSRVGQAMTSPGFGECTPRRMATGARWPYSSKRPVPPGGVPGDDELGVVHRDGMGGMAEEGLNHRRAANRRRRVPPRAVGVRERLAQHCIGQGATTRTCGLDWRASKATSRFTASSAEAQITAEAVSTCGGEACRGLQLHDGHLGVVQLVDDSQRKRVVTAHDDVSEHGQNATW